MDVVRNDSFSVSRGTESLVRKCFLTSVEWEIAGVKDRVGDRIGWTKEVISPIFQCSDVFWKLSITFRQDINRSNYSDTNQGDLSIRSSNQSTPNYCNFNFKYLILDPQGNTLDECVSGREAFTKYATISNPLHPAKSMNTLLLQQNSLKILFSICVEEASVTLLSLKKATEEFKDEKKTLQLSGHFLNLSSDFEELYNNPRLSDVTLKLGEVEFQAHKLVLSARSKVFAAMFEHDMTENRRNTVDLVQMEAEVVRDMLRHIYCGNVRELSAEGALKLYLAADRYDLQELKSFCRDVISNDVSVSNVCDIAAVADLHNDESLIGALKSFLLKNGKEFIKTEKWKSISSNQPTLCAKMFEWTFYE